MAWSLLTEHYGIPADRLYVSYFGGHSASGLPADEETRQIWLDIGYVSITSPPLGYSLFILVFFMTTCSSQGSTCSRSAIRPEGKLLGDGGHGPLWPLHRDPLRPRGRPRCGATRQRRQSRCGGDLEPGLHAVQQVCSCCSAP